VVSRPPLFCYGRSKMRPWGCTGYPLWVRWNQFWIVDSTEVVWDCKQDEDIDPGWFSQPDTDVLCVVAGQLRAEFRAELSTTLTLQPGDVLVLPPDTACRAYRWPRGSKQAAVFLAVTARSGPAGRATDHERATPSAESRLEGAR